MSHGASISAAFLSEDRSWVKMAHRCCSLNQKENTRVRKERPKQVPQPLWHVPPSSIRARDSGKADCLQMSGKGGLCVQTVVLLKSFVAGVGVSARKQVEVVCFPGLPAGESPKGGAS